MKSADEIERELHKRFSEQVYVGMSPYDYMSALTHVLIRYMAEELANVHGPSVVAAPSKETP